MSKDDGLLDPPQLTPKRPTPGPYNQTRPELAHRGIQYIQNVDGSTTQDPSTFTATKQNRKKVLPTQSGYSLDASEWIFNSGD